MIEIYLNFPGNAAEAAVFYAEAFGAKSPEMMTYSQMPAGADGGMTPEMAALIMHGNLETFAGNIMFSDDAPGEGLVPSRASWILVSHADYARLREAFDALARDGEILQPLEPAFFAPLYGQVKDKFGYYWMFMAPSPADG